MKNTEHFKPVEYDRILIGIDPDCDKSGVAMKRGKKIEVELLAFFDLFDVLKAVKGTNVFIRIEAGWLNEKSNFHAHKGQTKAAGERIAKNVGSNHEVGRKIAEMCDYLGLAYELVRPYKRKLTPEMFFIATGIKTRNSEKIDAAALIL